MRYFTNSEISRKFVLGLFLSIVLSLFVPVVSGAASGELFLTYSTFIGGGEGGCCPHDHIYDLAVDSEGYAYVTGYTVSTDFFTEGAYDTIYGGNDDAFVAKLSPDGKQIVYITYLGGSGSEHGRAIAVDSKGQAYVTGYTTSTDFLVNQNDFTLGLQPSHAVDSSNGDAFIVKLSSDGTRILYFSYFGGTGGESGYGIAVDSAVSEENAYIAGTTTSSNFPITEGAFDSTYHGEGDIFVAKISTLLTGSAGLIYSTLVGGSEEDANDYSEVAIDNSGNAYVAGRTRSTEESYVPFPLVGAYQSTHGEGYDDAFVFKLNSTGTALIYSTFLGGDDWDIAYGIDVGPISAEDATQVAYVTGYTRSTNFPVTESAYMTELKNGLGWNGNAFLTKLNADGSGILYSTYFGGSDSGWTDWGWEVQVAPAGIAFISGRTESPATFPTTADAFDRTHNGDYDWFMAKLDTTKSGAAALLYSTLMGSGWREDGAFGLAIDATGDNVYIGGWSGAGNGDDFPTLNAYKSVAEPVDSAIVRFSPNSMPDAEAGQDETNHRDATPILLSGECTDINSTDTLQGWWTVSAGTCDSVSGNSSENKVSDNSPVAVEYSCLRNATAGETLTFVLHCDDNGTPQLGDVDEVSVTINAAPTATPQSLSISEDTPTLIVLSGVDPELNIASYSIVQAPLHGELTGTSPILLFTPDANYFGEDSFTFIVNDGLQDSPEAASVSLSIASQNDVCTIEENANERYLILSSSSELLTLPVWETDDIDGDVVTTSWKFVSTPSGAHVPQIVDDKFDCSSICASGTYLLQMEGDEGNGSKCLSDMVEISTPNNAPLPPSADDIVISVGNELLPGNSEVMKFKLEEFAKQFTIAVPFEDYDHDALTYEWKMKGDKAVFSMTGNGEASVRARKAGTIKFEVTVTDGEASATLEFSFVNPGSKPKDIPLMLSQLEELEDGSYSVKGELLSPVEPFVVIGGIAASVFPVEGNKADPYLEMLAGDSISGYDVYRFIANGVTLGEGDVLFDIYIVAEADDEYEVIDGKIVTWGNVTGIEKLSGEKSGGELGGQTGGGELTGQAGASSSSSGGGCSFIGVTVPASSGQCLSVLVLLGSALFVLSMKRKNYFDQK